MDRFQVAGEAPEPILASVIEADANHLIGAALFARSLRHCGRPLDHRLAIVDRPGRDTRRALRMADCLGLNCIRVAPKHANPFLGKWLCLDAYPELLASPFLVILDWDVLFLGGRGFPRPRGKCIQCRPNPPDMYANLLKRIEPSLPDSCSQWRGRVPSSANSGVIVGSGPVLKECRNKTIRWEELISRAAPDARGWESEQLAFSLALGELDTSALPDSWNATPLSPVPDSAVILWHYNDGHPVTRSLKRNLTDPAIVRTHLDSLRLRWPRAISVFESCYRGLEREFPGLLRNTPMDDPNWSRDRDSCGVAVPTPVRLEEEAG